jgi:hypothetical protein
MTEYAILDRSASGPLFISRLVFFDLPPPPPIYKVGQVLPVEEDIKPVPSPSQVRIEAGLFIEPSRVLRKWALRAKTEEELDREVQAAVREQILAAYGDLINGAGTVGDRAARLERAVAWMLKHLVKPMELGR